MRSNHLSKHFFNSIFWRRKSLNTHFLLDNKINHWEVRAVRRITHQFDVPMYENSYWCSLLRFSNFSEDFRQTNCGVPLRIDRPTMLKWNSRHMTSFAEETGHHLLRSDFSTNNFRWIWLEFKDPHGGLLLCFRLIRTDP